MNQLAMSYEFERPEPRYPLSTQTQLWMLLNALKRGEKLTVLSALQSYQIYALSQRIGELKVLGWNIRSQMISVASGKKVAEYWLANV